MVRAPLWRGWWSGGGRWRGQGSGLVGAGIKAGQGRGRGAGPVPQGQHLWLEGGEEGRGGREGTGGTVVGAGGSPHSPGWALVLLASVPMGTGPSWSDCPAAHGAVNSWVQPGQA